MAASLFETMAVSLVDGTKEGVTIAGDAQLKDNIARPPLQPANDPLRQTSLVAADSTAFYTDAAFFANLPTRADNLIKEAVWNASRVAVKVRELAEMRCKDRTKVSQIALDKAMCEAIRFEKKYKAKEIANMKDKA